MKPSTYRILSILGSVVLFSAAIFAYTSFIQPAYREIRTLQDKRQSSEDLLKRQENAMVAVKQLSDKYQSLTDLRDVLSMSLPLGERIPEIINQFQGIAQADKIIIESLSLQYLPMVSAPADSGVESLGTIKIMARVSGPYKSINSFLDALQNNVRIMDINSIKVERGVARGNDMLTYNLTVDTYYQ